ncbi:uncharacterized protein LOC135393221 [Ornithodoros turicata]|uniref:uncharacterized protein LOC135393221 n=1 Tax=Ornithodoros turicata TaxID=34597 RepID=UPI003139BE11
MLQVHYTLTVALVIVCHTSVAKESAGAAHVRADTLKTEETGGLQHINVNVVSSDAQTMTSKQMQNIVAEKQPVLDANQAASDSSLPVQRTGTVSADMLAQVVLDLTNTVKVLSQSIQRLSDDVKEQRTEILQRIDTFKTENMRGLSKIESVPGHLQDLSLRLIRLEKESTDKLVAIKAAVTAPSKLFRQDIQNSDPSLKMYGRDHNQRKAKLRAELQHYTDSSFHMKTSQNMSTEVANSVSRAVAGSLEDLSRKLELSEKQNIGRFTRMEAVAEQLRDDSKFIRHSSNFVTETCKKIEPLVHEQRAHIAELRREMNGTLEHLQRSNLNETCASFSSFSSSAFSHIQESVYPLVFSAMATLTKIQSEIPEEIRNLKRDIGAVSTTIKNIAGNALTRLEQVESLVGKVKTTIEGPTERLSTVRSAYPTVFFHVQNITEHIAKSKASRKDSGLDSSIWSEKFVIGGYTAALELGVSVRKHNVWIGAYLHLCSGSRDSLLHWPFRSNYTVSVIHSRDPTKDIHRVVSRNKLNRCPNAVKRPDEECNKGCGYNRIVTHEAANTDGHLFNDAITIGVTLHPEATATAKAES